MSAFTLKDKVVIGVAGMPGAGKGIVVEVAKKMGFGVIIMGDEVREETKRRDLKSTPETVGKVTLKMRRESGPAVVAERCISKIENLSNKVVIVDGIRSLYETDTFKKHFPNFKLLAIHSSVGTRFERLFKRKRSDDPARWETFLERDWRELHVGLGNVIASAETMIVNEGKKAEFKKEVKRLLGNITKNE